jgi:hypothetical protein
MTGQLSLIESNEPAEPVNPVVAEDARSRMRKQRQRMRKIAALIGCDLHDCMAEAYAQWSDSVVAKARG